ncbi:MAG: alpha/beta hydrolase domain-containing protein, partial [Bryobacteraceae bacterium]
PTLVPQVDADGNEIAGVRMPEIRVPLGNYTGWNYKFPGQMYAFTGAWFPFTKTKGGRERAHDPRPSVEERYSTRADYLMKVETATQAMIGEGFLLDIDRQRVLDHAAAEWDYVMAK